MCSILVSHYQETPKNETAAYLNQLASHCRLTSGATATQDERPYRPKLEPVHVVWPERRAANVCDSSSAAGAKKAEAKVVLGDMTNATDSRGPRRARSHQRTRRPSPASRKSTGGNASPAQAFAVVHWAKFCRSRGGRRCRAKVADDVSRLRIVLMKDPLQSSRPAQWLCRGPNEG